MGSATGCYAAFCFWIQSGRPRRTAMLQLGDEVTLYSLVFVVVLLGTRSPVWTTAITASFYLFLAVFRYPQVPANRVRQVLHPIRGTTGSGKVSVVAHRGGGHDAPENTLAAIQEVRSLRAILLVSRDSSPRSPSAVMEDSLRPEAAMCNIFIPEE